MISLIYALRGFKKVEDAFLFILKKKVPAITLLYCALPRDT